MANNSTYRNIQDNVLALLGKSDSTTRGRVKEWINMGQDDFVLRELWPFREKTSTISTVAGTQEYDLSTKFTDIDQQNIIKVTIQGAAGRPLPYIAFNQLREMHPDLDAESGIPSYYYIKAGQIGLWPVPNAVFTVAVDYYCVPTALDADDDTSIIPPAYRQALNAFALSREHDYDSDPDLAIKEMNSYEQFIDKARQNLLAQPVDGGNFVLQGPPMDWTGLSGTVR